MRAIFCVALALTASAARAQDTVTPYPAALSGDVGLGATWTQPAAPGASPQTRALPYVYADYGRFFAREDTFGVKLLPVGWGSLELAARVSTEGLDDDGPRQAHRRNPRPVGLGTFQETPWGGVFLNAFVDTVSGGTLLEASYAAEFHAGPVTLYPQAGLAWRSARYTAHLYGTADDRPGASTTPTLGLSAELPLFDRWVLVGHVQRTRFDDAVRDSPRVDRAGQTSALLALAWRFG